MSLLFGNDYYIVGSNNETVQLLKKEYELLKYLYTHANRSFTRDELLDAIWEMEDPVDRTVDDHIYRLRKKTRDLKDEFTIETVKGYGYRLSIHTKTIYPSPLVGDKEFDELSKNLLSKYHLYGQGSALKLLLQNKTLGIQANEYTKVISMMIDGKFHEMIHSQEVPLSEKLFFLIHFYLLIEEDREKVIQYFEKALKDNLFTGPRKEEATVLSPIYFYILSKDYKKADVYLNQADEKVIPKDHGFYPFLQLSKVMYYIALKQLSEAERVIHYMDDFLEQSPYQREYGFFYILKGLWLITSSHITEGRKLIIEGIKITKDTGFKFHVFFTLGMCKFFLQHHVDDSVTLKQINQEWEMLDERYHFSDLKKEVEYMLEQNIKQ